MSQAHDSDVLAAALRVIGAGLWRVGLASVVLNALVLVSPLYMLQIYDRVLAGSATFFL